MIFWQNVSVFQWKATPITSLMRRHFRIVGKNSGKCLALLERTYLKAMTSVHLHFCFHYQAELLGLRLEITLPS